MDIMEIIDMLEEIVDKAPTMPLTGKVLVSKEEILDYVQALRLNYPEELREAKWVKEERQRILSEAENKAESMQKNTEEKMVQLVNEHEITRQAYEQANEMVMNAKNQAIEIKKDCDKYADDVLGDVEHRLEMLLQKVKEDRSYYQK